MKKLVILLFAALATGLPILDRMFFPTVHGPDKFARIVAIAILLASPVVTVVGPLFFIEKKLLMEKTKWPILFFPVVWVSFTFLLSFFQLLDEGMMRSMFAVLFVEPVFVIDVYSSSEKLLAGFCFGATCLLPILYLKMKKVELQSKLKYYACLILYLYLNIIFISAIWKIMFFE